MAISEHDKQVIAKYKGYIDIVRKAIVDEMTDNKAHNLDNHNTKTPKQAHQSPAICNHRHFRNYLHIKKNSNS